MIGLQNAIRMMVPAPAPSRVQLILTRQGPFGRDPRIELMIAIGFAFVGADWPAGDAMADMRILPPDGNSKGSIAFDQPRPFTDPSSDRPIDQDSVDHILTREAWSLPTFDGLPSNGAFGQAMTRETSIEIDGAAVRILTGLALTKRGDTFERYKRYDFAGNDLACGEPDDIEALRFCMGNPPRFYLRQPGWSIAGEPAGIASDLRPDALRDLDEHNRLEFDGSDPERLAFLRKKRWDILSVTRDEKQFVPFKKAFAEGCLAEGLKPFDSLTPRTAACITARDRIGEDAMRRILDDEDSDFH